MKSVAELQAELALRAQERKEAIAEKIAVIKLEKELDYLASDLYEKRQLIESDNNTLDAIIGTVTDIAVANKRKVSQTYAFGTIPNKIVTICKAILYSKAEDKELLLAMAKLTEDTVEAVTDAFGMTAYFSPQQMAIIPAVPMDIDKVRELIAQAAQDMGLVSDIDLSKFNPDNVKYQYDRAQLRAEESLENTLKYLDEDDIEFIE